MKNKVVTYFTLLVLMLGSQFSAAQDGFRENDLILSLNYGGPQITPLVLRTAINLYYKNRKNEQFTFGITNSGVFNGKLEYAPFENLGLGVAASYWNMGVSLQNNYTKNDPVTGQNQAYVDNYSMNISAFAIGIRGNYHFVDDWDIKGIDPYYGITIGVTKYSYDVSFNSTFPGKQLPLDTYKYNPGLPTYFSTTIGVRYYPIKFVGINLEAGWDRGAFLFGGVVFKINTKGK